MVAGVRRGLRRGGGLGCGGRDSLWGASEGGGQVKAGPEHRGRAAEGSPRWQGLLRGTDRDRTGQRSWSSRGRSGGCSPPRWRVLQAELGEWLLRREGCSSGWAGPGHGSEGCGRGAFHVTERNETGTGWRFWILLDLCPCPPPTPKASDKGAELSWAGRGAAGGWGEGVCLREAPGGQWLVERHLSERGRRARENEGPCAPSRHVTLPPPRCNRSGSRSHKCWELYTF